MTCSRQHSGDHGSDEQPRHVIINFYLQIQHTAVETVYKFLCFPSPSFKVHCSFPYTVPYCIPGPSTWLVCLRRLRTGKADEDSLPTPSRCWCVRLESASVDQRLAPITKEYMEVFRSFIFYATTVSKLRGNPTPLPDRALPTHENWGRATDCGS